MLLEGDNFVICITINLVRQLDKIAKSIFDFYWLPLSTLTFNVKLDDVNVLSSI